MFSKISILLPTRGRVVSLGRLLRSMRHTETDWSKVELLTRCDDDDPDTVAFLKEQGFTPLVGPRYGGYASASRFQNELLAIATGDLVFAINDDAEFQTKNWDDQILAAANRYPDGIFNIGVEAELNSHLHPFPILSRRYTEILGHFAPEGLIFTDIYHLAIARAFDRVVELPSVVLKHHWVEQVEAETDTVRGDVQLAVVDLTIPTKPEKDRTFDDIFTNWRSDYKAKHDQLVEIAIAKIRAALKKTPPPVVPGLIAASRPAGSRRWSLRAMSAKLKHWRELAAIRPLFDSAWYLSQNPDVAAAGVDPLLHYLRYGGAEGRNPHPLFAGAWYLAKNPDVAAAGINPLVHFVRYGGFEARDPNPLFDSAWYLSEYTEAQRAGLNPLEHFIRRRARRAA